MIPADIKAKKKKEIKRSGVWIYLNFDKKYLQNLKHNVKKAYMYFSFNFGWYSILLLSVKNMFFFKEHLLRTVNREVGGF